MHFHLIVIGNEPLEELMEPFCQDLEVPEYCNGEVSDGEKARMMDFYREEGIKFRSFADLYKKKGDDWNFNRWRKDDDGVWREYSTSNPNMQWDWYEVGGRWPGQLKLKDGVTGNHQVNFSWGWTQKDIKEFLETHGNVADVAYIEEIANLDTLTAFAILKDGEWMEVEGEETLLPYFEDVPDGTLITSVDYHM